MLFDQKIPNKVFVSLCLDRLRIANVKKIKIFRKENLRIEKKNSLFFFSVSCNMILINNCDQNFLMPFCAKYQTNLIYKSIKNFFLEFK